MHSGHFVNRNNLLKIGLLLLLLLLLYLKRFGDMLYKKLSSFVCFHFFLLQPVDFEGLISLISYALIRWRDFYCTKTFCCFSLSSLCHQESGERQKESARWKLGREKGFCQFPLHIVPCAFFIISVLFLQYPERVSTEEDTVFKLKLIAFPAYLVYAWTSFLNTFRGRFIQDCISHLKTLSPTTDMTVTLIN